MIKLNTEQYYRSLIFASCDNANCNLHPKLVVSYSIPTNVYEINDNEFFSISHNPSSGNLICIWNTGLAAFHEIQITNNLGQLISDKTTVFSAQGSCRINLSSEAKGIYFITLISKNNRVVKKIVIN